MSLFKQTLANQPENQLLRFQNETKRELTGLMKYLTLIKKVLSHGSLESYALHSEIRIIQLKIVFAFICKLYFRQVDTIFSTSQDNAKEFQRIFVKFNSLCVVDGVLVLLLAAIAFREDICAGDVNDRIFVCPLCCSYEVQMWLLSN